MKGSHKGSSSGDTEVKPRRNPGPAKAPGTWELSTKRACKVYITKNYSSLAKVSIAQGLSEAFMYALFINKHSKKLTNESGTTKVQWILSSG